MLARGETVILSLSTGDASLGAPVGFVDSNGSTRLLMSNERVIVTEFHAIVSICAQPLIVYQSSTLLTNPVLAITSPGGWQTAFEGMPFPHAQYPWVSTCQAGTIIVTGTGYIVQDGGYTNQPPWIERAKLT